MTKRIDTEGLLWRTPLHRCDVRAAEGCSSLMCRWPVATVIASFAGLFALPIFRLSYGLLWIVSTTGCRVPASGVSLPTCSATRETAELRVSAGNWVMKVTVQTVIYWCIIIFFKSSYKINMFCLLWQGTNAYFGNPNTDKFCWISYLGISVWKKNKWNSTQWKEGCSVDCLPELGHYCCCCLFLFLFLEHEPAQTNVILHKTTPDCLKL